MSIPNRCAPASGPTSGNFVFDKHKIFLYKEDFEKFKEGLNDAIEYIKVQCLHGEPIVEHEHVEREDEF